jgi:hypothetical protein
MNRSQRRREKWMKLNPKLPYREFVADVSEDSAKVMMVMLRKLGGDAMPFDDETIWNSTRELINIGFLNVYFRFAENGIEIKPEFILPSPPMVENSRDVGTMQ